MADGKDGALTDEERQLIVELHEHRIDAKKIQGCLMRMGVCVPNLQRIAGVIAAYEAMKKAKEGGGG